MYADRVDAAAKTSIKDRLNGNSIGDSARLRQFTGKRQRQDDKWEHDLYDDGGPRVSNHKIDARDLRLKLQRKSLQQVSPRSGVRDLREKLSGTMNSHPTSVDPPRPKIAVAKPARKSVAVEAPEPEIKKTATVVSRKGYQQKVERMKNSVHIRSNWDGSTILLVPKLPTQMDSSVDGFLQSLGLEKYLITFQAEEVDMTALVHMTDDDLKALGIPMGPRKKILLALESRG